MAENRIPLTGKAKETIEGLVKQSQRISQAINDYTQGVIDSKELEGVWKLNLQTLELEKQDEKPKEG